MNLYMENGSNPFDDFERDVIQPIRDMQWEHWMHETDRPIEQLWMSGWDLFYLPALGILGVAVLVVALVVKAVRTVYGSYWSYRPRVQRQRRMSPRRQRRHRLRKWWRQRSWRRKTLGEKLREEARQLITPQPNGAPVARMQEAVRKIEKMISPEGKYASILSNHERLWKALEKERKRLLKLIDQHTDAEFAKIELLFNQPAKTEAEAEQNR